MQNSLYISCYIQNRMRLEYKRIAYHWFRLILSVQMQSSEDVYQYSCAFQQVVEQ